MKALIDADQVAIACAFTAEEESAGIACSRAGQMVESILADSGADSYELWLSGPENFRKSVYPEYKATRKSPRPKWEQEVKQYLVDEWQANYSDGVEADDMLGIRQYEIHKFEQAFKSVHHFDAGYLPDTFESIICHQDKDINQIAGWHFNWELKRLGEVIKEKSTYFVKPDDGDFLFFYQLLVGDSVDNIKGAPGIGAKKATGILHGCSNNRERYEQCLSQFSCEEELDMNAKCVYIWRKYNDNWRNLIE